jgi:hypothetical protein
MAQHKDLVVAEVRRIRDRVSRRLLAARRQGRLHEELVAIEAEGMRAYREALNGSSNGHRKGK